MKPFPQRLATPAPGGTLFKQRERIARRPLPSADVGVGDYLNAIRQLPCLKCMMEPSEAAHVRLNSAAFNKRQAMAKKPEPKWCLPLCAGCHTRDPDALHRTGEWLFWQQLGISPFLICEKLYAARGDLVRMRAVALQAIAERGS